MIIQTIFFKKLARDLFQIEPFKALLLIQKLIAQNPLKIHPFYVEYLTTIFTRNLDQILKVLTLGESTPSGIAEMYMVLIELLISVFSENLQQRRVMAFMESRMIIMSLLEELLLRNLSKLL